MKERPDPNRLAPLRVGWRRLPQEPQTPLGWWWRETRSKLFLYGAIPSVALGMFVAARLVLSATLGLAAFAVLAVLGIALLRRKERRDESLAQLVPSPAPVETFPVEFTVSYQEVCTGRDQGAAAFVDGWLHVEGLRTGFSVRALDLVTAKALPHGAERLELPGGQAIEIRSLGSANDRATFAETVRVWFRFSVTPPPGEPVLPSLRVHPSAFVRPFSVLFSAIPLVAAACLLIVLAWGESSAFMLFITFPMLITPLFRAYGKMYRDLKQLPAIDRMGRETEEIATVILRARS